MSDLKILAEFKYKLEPVEKGYTNRTLYVNVGDHRIEEKPVTQDMKDTFIGGRGFGLWLLWHAVKDTTKWNDPDNEIVISSGPLGGITQYPGTGKSLVVSLSPTTDVAADHVKVGAFGVFVGEVG